MVHYYEDRGLTKQGELSIKDAIITYIDKSYCVELWANL